MIYPARCTVILIAQITYVNLKFLTFRILIGLLHTNFGFERSKYGIIYSLSTIHFSLFRHCREQQKPRRDSRGFGLSGYYTVSTLINLTWYKSMVSS